MLVDVPDGLTHGRNLLGVFVRDLPAKLLLEGHNQLHQVQGIGLQILPEPRLARDLGRVGAEKLGDDPLYLVKRVGHGWAPPSWSRECRYCNRSSHRPSVDTPSSGW